MDWSLTMVEKLSIILFIEIVENLSGPCSPIFPGESRDYGLLITSNLTNKSLARAKEERSEDA
jgi:hypothetical protein